MNDYEEFEYLFNLLDDTTSIDNSGPVLIDLMERDWNKERYKLLKNLDFLAGTFNPNNITKEDLKKEELREYIEFFCKDLIFQSARENFKLGVNHYDYIDYGLCGLRSAMDEYVELKDSNVKFREYAKEIIDAYLSSTMSVDRLDAAAVSLKPLDVCLSCFSEKYPYRYLTDERIDEMLIHLKTYSSVNPAIRRRLVHSQLKTLTNMVTERYVNGISPYRMVYMAYTALNQFVYAYNPNCDGNFREGVSHTITLAIDKAISQWKAGGSIDEKIR